VGEQPPVRGGAGSPQNAATAVPADRWAAEGSDWGSGAERSTLGYDELFKRAAAEAGEWRTLTLTLPNDAAAPTVRFSIDQGNGGQPQRRHALTLATATGAVTTWAPFSSQSTGQKARSWIRFLHTGEALGILGQTVAGLVSLTSLLMVWTGFALAWRRLIRPLLARKDATRRASAA
jgi:uncharacterized iron-regulated membrane protein